MYVQSIHLHTYETSCAKTYCRQPSAVSHSPNPATRAHARRHVRRPSPVGAAGMAVCAYCGTAGLNLCSSSFASRPRQDTFR